MDDSMAKALLAAEIRRGVQNLRRDYFSLVDSLRTEDLDNVEALTDILKDADFAKKFSLFPEHKNQLIRKEILDSSNNLERNLLAFLEDVDIILKQGIQLQALIRK